MLTFNEVCAEFSSKYNLDAADAAEAREEMAINLSLSFSPMDFHDAEWTKQCYTSQELDKIWRTVETLNAHEDALENYDKRQQQGIYNESGTQIGSTCRCEDYPCCGH